MAAPHKIIIDTDPGQDDAIAILLALASPELDVLGIVAVAGNVPLDYTTKNALILMELAGKTNVPVYAGCDKPLQRPLVTAEHVHGKTGLDGPTLPDPKIKVRDQHGVDFIVETLAAHEPNTITLATLGPLTNIAQALLKVPETTKRAKQIVMMGGGYFEGGNITPSAEFNIYVDPHAADIVFRSGIPIVMAPLDVTHKALTTQKRLDSLRAYDTPVCTAAAQLLDFFERYDEEKYGLDGGPLHDPCVIAWILRPDIFKGRDCNVEIEIQSELTLGATVIDWWGVTDRSKNAHVLGDLDANAFFDLITTRIATL